MRQQLRGGVDDCGGSVMRLRNLCHLYADVVRGWVLQLIAATPQRSESAEVRLKLGAHGLFDGVMPALGSRPEALLRQKGGTCEARRVVCQGVAAVRVGRPERQR